MFKMGGLRKELHLTFWTFLVGAASLSALPLVTAGFYSKDKILWDVWSSPAGGPWLWAAGLAGALLTSVYTFRMVFLTFLGEQQPFVQKHTPLIRPGLRMHLPLVVLAVLSIFSGLIELPATLGNVPLFSDFMHTTLPPLDKAVSGSGSELLFQIIAAVVSLAGVYVAYVFFVQRRQLTARLTATPAGALLHHFWSAGWGFDWLDNELIVQPFLWLARKDKNAVIDRIYDGIAALNVAGYRLLSDTQNGQLRRYAVGIALGAIVTLAMVILL